MKTITEFSGFVLKEAIAKKAALITEGKTEEEAQTAIHEQLKLTDETKIAFYKNAVDMTSSRIDRVKRVVVALKSSDTEKVPETFAEREGHFYLVEYFPSADSRGAQTRGREDDRFDRGGRGKGRGGRDGGRGDRNERGGRGGDRPRNDRPRSDFPRRDENAPRPEGTFAARDPNAPAPEKRAPRPPRAPKPPRAPRPERAPRGPKGAGELRLVLKGQSTTLQGSGTAGAVETPATPSAE